MFDTKSKAWLAAYAERVRDIPGLPPEKFGLRLLESRSGSESALHEICSASLKIALDVARDIWETDPQSPRARAVWELVQEANSVIVTAIRSFFGADWQEFQSHLRTTVRMKLG